MLCAWKGRPVKGGGWGIKQKEKTKSTVWSTVLISKSCEFPGVSDLWPERPCQVGN